MTTDQRIEAHFERERARREAPVAKPDDATTPQQKLVRAAETGRFEAIVAAAQPAEPPKMVTPEEREAELRAAGKAVEDKPPSKPGPKGKPRKKKPVPEPGMPTEPTPGMQWAEEHLRRRSRGSGDRLPTHNAYRCKTEYDPLTGEIIGDGYIHYDDEDDA